MKTFVTLFNCQNVHLIKDVGMIPFGMYKYCGYDAYIATYNNDDYFYLDREVKGLKLEYVKKTTGKFFIDSVYYLIKNAKKIDILNLYHATVLSALQTFFYKVFNKKGIVYIKLDGGRLKNETQWYKYPFRKYCFKHANYITAEIESRKRELEDDWGIHLGLVTNPYNPLELQEFRPFNLRENTIITVGRIGTTQKASEILMEGFRMISDALPGWKLKIVGPIEESFKPYIDDWFNKYPSMKDRVSFEGNVSDRQMLGELYRDSKLYVSSSRWESYGIATMEAELNGCYIIATDIPASRALTNDFKYGKSFPIDDIEALGNCILSSCLDLAKTENLAKKGYAYIKTTCSLKKVCESIEQGLKESTQNRT